MLLFALAVAVLIFCLLLCALFRVMPEPAAVANLALLAERVDTLSLGALVLLPVVAWHRTFAKLELDTGVHVASLLLGELNGVVVCRPRLEPRFVSRPRSASAPLTCP